MPLPVEVHRDLDCGCAAPVSPAINRRWLLRSAGAGVLLAASTRLILAASGKYEAMILACIDPRMQEPVHAYAAKRGLTRQYSQFVIAGA